MVLAAVALLTLAASADSALAYGYTTLSSYVCPASYPIAHCNAFGDCFCWKT